MNHPTTVPNFLTLLTQATDAAKALQEENAQLRKELEEALQQMSILDEFKAFVAQRQTASVPVENDVYSPLQMKRDRRAALNTYLESGKHLTQSNKTIAKRFGMSISNVATIISTMTKEGRIAPRKRGRPVVTSGAGVQLEMAQS